ATQMFRAPSTFSTHATLPPTGPAINSVANGALRICSSVTCCPARGAANVASAAASRPAAARLSSFILLSQVDTLRVAIRATREVGVVRFREGNREVHIGSERRILRPVIRPRRKHLPLGP